LTSVAVGAIALLVSVLAYLLVRHELYARLDRTLDERALALRSEARAESTAQRLSIVAAPGELVQVLRADGRTILPPYQVTSLPQGSRERAVAAGASSLAETVRVDGERMRVLTERVGPGFALQIARTVADEDSALRRLRFALAMLGLSALFLSFVLGGWIAQTALAPVRRLTRAAEAVAATQDLSLRLDETGKDEVARLGAAFNKMLAALERSLAAQRRLVADASHEFRTPLTSIRANAELMARGTVREDELETVAREVVDQVDELDGLVTDVIELAVDGDVEQARFDDVRLDTVVEAEVERIRRYAPAIRVEVSGEETSVHGDAERLQRAVSNILSNAVKWSPPNGTVHVSVADGVVSVRDSGPGIDEADLPF